jgi:PPOX class probable F420-dependent enzyme
MVELPQSAVELIESGRNAHVITVNPDGSPQSSLVWVGFDEGELCIPSLTPRQKLRNVRRDPRVLVSIEAADADATGLTHYLVVIGRARVVEGGAPELLREMALRYLAPGVKFPRGDDPPPGFVMRIAPERWRGYGPWGEGPQATSPG